MLASPNDYKKEVIPYSPQHTCRTSSIILHGPVEDVFPLFGPVREQEWAEGWEPQLIFPSGAVVEEQMIFRTRAHFEGEDDYLWSVSRYNTKEYRINYTVTATGRIWFINVQCEPAGTMTRATITYSYIGLSEKGHELNQRALENMFAHDLKDWEEAINFYLQFGKQYSVTTKK